jgi:hypothetical protein
MALESLTMVDTLSDNHIKVKKIVEFAKALNEEARDFCRVDITEHLLNASLIAK